MTTLPETNIARENPIFPGKYHQNGGFSMAMLVSGRVIPISRLKKKHPRHADSLFWAILLGAPHNSQTKITMYRGCGTPSIHGLNFMAYKWGLHT